VTHCLNNNAAFYDQKIIFFVRTISYANADSAYLHGKICKRNKQQNSLDGHAKLITAKLIILGPIISCLLINIYSTNMVRNLQKNPTHRPASKALSTLISTI
jgi:hypothetical protein